MAPQVGLEPTTLRLTAECSAIELLRTKGSGGDLCFRAVSSQVLSALKGLTSVFGMGTGGTPSSLPPEMVNEIVSFLRAHDPALRKTISAASQLFPPHVAAAALAHPDNCTGEDSLSDLVVMFVC